MMPCAGGTLPAQTEAVCKHHKENKNKLILIF